MVKKIIISHFNNLAAILFNNKIQEIVVINDTYQVNDIYIGIVHKIFSSINAAFIKLGRHGKSGFIHVSNARFLQRGKVKQNIADILSINQLILVQVIKEPTLNKGPRLTTNIHLYGKYIILTPFCNTISISHKIYDESERTYLYALAILLKPYNMGLIIRPYAQGVEEKAIVQDLDLLKKQWNFIQKSIILNSYPSLLYKDEDLIKKVIRDFYDNGYQKIIIDSDIGLRRLYYYLYKWFCISSKTNVQLQLYNNNICILKKFDIPKAINNALKSKVNLLFGGYLIIDHHEALTTIDVNSGSFNKTDSSKEAILRMNCSAAIEIAHQLKIRNLNGVIIVDFIDMYSPKDQLQLLEHFAKLLKQDHAKPQIIQLSQLGLVELTRRRRGQSLQEIFGRYHLYDSDIYYSISLNFFESFYLQNVHIKDNILINKNINVLFFSKKFSQNLCLESKNFVPRSLIIYKYFFYFDTNYTVIFFNPKANYLVPLSLYLDLIR
uniref:Ribonuclease E n=1 Tax=Crouania attenuata TaxID=42002 RepID=A0A4D6WPI7_9FLOR|nr:ribonuclease E [Crouania attenuata]